MNATYSKSMIELVYEIRRRIESDLKPSIKLANPDLLIELAHYFPDCKDAILRALIKELMEIAGTEWQERLTKPQSFQDESHILKAYRGSVSVETIQTPKAATAQPAENSSKMVYRGCVIER